MGKGQIISGGEAGQYSVKLLYKRDKALKALERINGWIAMREEQIYALWYNDPENKLPMLKLALASLKKWKEYYESIPEDPTIDAWCADYSEELSGEVGTIEINGDIDTVIIRPGYDDSAVYDQETDGQLQHIKAMTPEQWFYNAAMKPGWQKWMPTFRTGVITYIEDDVCTVSLDSAQAQIVNAGSKSINESSTLYDVEIDYMDCNGNAFESGDHVVVMFSGQDFDSPKVVGFVDHPEACDRNLLVVRVEFHDLDSAQDSPPYSVQRYDYDQDLIAAFYGQLYINRTHLYESGKNAFFVWDIDANDYADEKQKVYWVDPNDPDKIKHFLKRTDYPFITNIDGNILSEWESRTPSILNKLYEFEELITNHNTGDPMDSFPDAIYSGPPSIEHSVSGSYVGPSCMSGFYSGWHFGEDNSFADGEMNHTICSKLIGNKACSYGNENWDEIDDFIMDGTSISSFHRSFDYIYALSNTYINNSAYSLTAKLNPISDVIWNYSRASKVFWDVDTETTFDRIVNGDFIKVFGGDSFISKSHAVQIYTYRGYNRNTFAQTAKRDKLTGLFSVSERNNALEIACKTLIDTLSPLYEERFAYDYGNSEGSYLGDAFQPAAIELKAEYFKGQTTKQGMLDLLDEKREQLFT